MSIEITQVEERSDGSALVTIDLGAKEVKLLLGLGLNKLLESAIALEEEYEQV